MNSKDDQKATLKHINRKRCFHTLTRRPHITKNFVNTSDSKIDNQFWAAIVINPKFS